MPLRDILLALAVVCGWALNIIVVKMGVGEIPPVFMSALRFALVAVLVVPFTRITRAQWPWVLLISFTFGTLHFGVLFAALAMAEAGTSAILIQIGAPIATVLACVILREKLGLLRCLGLIISVAGIGILAASPTMPGPLALTLLMISATGWAVTNLIIKQMPDIRPVTLMGWTSLLSMPQLFLISWLFESHQWQMLETAGWHGWLSVIYSAVVSSIIGYGIWYWLLQRHSINAVVPYSMLNPLLAVLFGIVLLDEIPSMLKLVGGLVMLGGVMLILRKPDTGLPDTA